MVPWEGLGGILMGSLIVRSICLQSRYSYNNEKEVFKHLNKRRRI